MNKITTDRIKEYLESCMEDMTIPKVVLAFATKYQGKRLTDKYINELPTMTTEGEEGYWCITIRDIVFQTLKFIINEDEETGEPKDHPVYQFIIGYKKRALWDPEFIQKENSLIYQQTPLRNTRREALIADENWLMETADLLSKLVRAQEAFTESYQLLEKKTEKDDLLCAELVRDVARLEFGPVTEDMEHCSVLTIFQ